MRNCFACLLAAIVVAIVFGAPTLARAQDSPTGTRAEDSSHKLAKIIVGSCAIAVGIGIAATSSQSTTVNGSETSTFSKSQLITGLALAGGGGIVLWDGLRVHDRTASTAVGVSAGKHSGGVFIRRVW